MVRSPIGGYSTVGQLGFFRACANLPYFQGTPVESFPGVQVVAPPGPAIVAPVTPPAAVPPPAPPPASYIVYQDAGPPVVMTPNPQPIYSVPKTPIEMRGRAGGAGGATAWVQPAPIPDLRTVVTPVSTVPITRPGGKVVSTMQGTSDLRGLGCAGCGSGRLSCAGCGGGIGALVPLRGGGGRYQGCTGCRSCGYRGEPNCHDCAGMGCPMFGSPRALAAELTRSRAVAAGSGVSGLGETFLESTAGKVAVIGGLGLLLLLVSKGGSKAPATTRTLSIA